MRSLSKFAGASVPAIVTTLLFPLLAGAQQKTGFPRRPGAQKPGALNPGGSPEAPRSVDLSPRNKLVFPYGVQSFELKERLEVGNAVTRIPGWSLVGSVDVVSASVAESGGVARPGTSSKSWLRVQDLGARETDGILSPPIHAPAPWNYAWSFALRIDSAPASAADSPVLAIQHDDLAFQDVDGDRVDDLTFGDAWGVRIGPAGAELFVTSTWGGPTTAPLFAYQGATAIGEWIDVRVVASLANRTLTAFVGGTEVATVRTRPAETTNVSRLRFAYHGSGAGHVGSVLLDDIGVVFLNPVCNELLVFDFETGDDFVTPMGNGQKVDTEFGEHVNITSAGSNLGPTTFDSTPGGPNDPSINEDMLVGHGNLLLLQSDTLPTETVPGFFDTITDDADGGDLIFDFVRLVDPQSLLLADINPPPNLGASVTLVDGNGAQRVYAIPPGWTGTYGDAGPFLLDLTSALAQVGAGPWFRVATAVEDPGFVQNGVTRVVVHITGFGAMDELIVIEPCVQMAFEVEDDVTPLFVGTAIADGQDLSSPPEFGVDVALTSAGLNAGAAAFDSTPGGPNDPGPDNDLLVGLGNILILQSNNAAGHNTQTVPGFFDTPNDDVNGGDFFFGFVSATCHQLDLIDADEEERDGVTITLLDGSGGTRVFTIPPSWTEDILNDGPPGFRTLDLETLANQPGFASTATAVEDAGFDPTDVVQMTVHMGGAQALDNFCFCP